MSEQRYSDDEISEAFKLNRDEGMTYEQIQEELGIPKSTLSRRFKQMRAPEEKDSGNSEEQEGGPALDNYLVAAARALFPDSKRTQRTSQAVLDEPEKYMNNPSQFRTLLRASGFNNNQTDAIMSLAETKKMSGGSGGSAQFGGDGGSTAMIDRIMGWAQNLLMMKETMRHLGPILGEKSQEPGGGGGGSFSEELREMRTEMAKTAFMKNLLDTGGDGGRGVSTIKLPDPEATAREGEPQFKEVPVKSEGGAMMEMMLPMMLMNKGGSDEAEMLQALGTVLGEIKGDDQSEKIMEMALEREGDKVKHEREMFDEKLSSLRDRLDDMKEKSGEGSLFEFLDKAKDYEEFMPGLFGAEDKIWEHKKDMKQLEIEHLGDTIEQRTKLLDKIADIEARMKLTEGIGALVQEGLGSFLEPVGKEFGKRGLDGLLGGGEQGKESQPPGGLGMPGPGAEQPPEGSGEGEDIERLKKLTLQSLGQLRQKGEEDFLRAVRENLSR